MALAFLACAVLPTASSASRVSSPLTVTDSTGLDGTITVRTPDWKLVFDALYNGGIHQWFDLAADPLEADSLAGALAGTFPYSQGALFGYQAYLHDSPSMEFMTTLGINPSPGSLELTVLESTPARVRIRQRGQPRLNNGAGPLADVFPELGLITATTDWSIYPSGKVHIHFTTDVVAGGITIDSGPGGAGKGINATGCCGNERQLLATGGLDFREEGILPGDTIQSSAGGWGPILIVDRPSSTEVRLAAPVPAGTALDYVVRRTQIAGETISIHGDGDPNSGCTIHPWQGGSIDKPLWSDAPLFQFVPNLAGQYLLAQWTTGDRSAGSLLAFFEPPWPDPNFAAFDSCFYQDISYTQVGRFVRQPPQARHLHLLAHMGSAATCGLPTIKSVADALPFGRDYKVPWAEALVGTLDTGPEIASAGFDPGTGTYGVAASSVAPAVCGAAGPPCYEAVVRLDTQGAGRAGAAYETPAVLLSAFPVPDAAVSVEMSTDGGSTFAPLASRFYNLTGEGEEGALGAGRRLFQYLAEVPASATGASAVAFRFVGPSATPSPSVSGPCPTAPVVGCRTPGKSAFQIKNVGTVRNKLTWRWQKGDAPVAGFGTPTACGALQTLCVYDAVASTPALAFTGTARGGGLCLGKPCWKAALRHGVLVGYKFNDRTQRQAGLRSISLRGGTPGEDKISFTSKGLTVPLPTPVSPTQYFRHEGNVVVQLLGNGGDCWQDTYAPTDVRQNEPDSYSAKRGM